MADSVLGLIVLGSDAPSSLTPEHLDIASAMAKQITFLIDKFRSIDFNQEQTHNLVRLDQVCQYLLPPKDPEQLSQEIARLATDLVGWTDARLYRHHPQLRVLECYAAYPPTSNPGQPVLYDDVLVGKAANTGQTQVLLGHDGFDRALAIPMKRPGGWEGVLYVANRHSTRKSLHADRELLERFAVRSWFAMATAELLKAGRGRITAAELFHQVSAFIQSTEDVDQIVHVVLTAITANYGLRLNNTAVFLLDNRGSWMCKMAIGHFEAPKALEDWQRDEQDGLVAFTSYLARLRQGPMPLTPLASALIGKSFCFDAAHSFKDCVPAAAYDRWLPQDFKAVYQPRASVVCAPLVVRGKTIGLIICDNRITEETISLATQNNLMTLSGILAGAIENIRLHQQTRIEAESNADRVRYLEHQDQVVQTMSAAFDSPDVLRSIVGGTMDLFHADVGLLWTFDSDPSNPLSPSEMAAAGVSPEQIEQLRAREPRQGGLSDHVLCTGYLSVFDVTTSDLKCINSVRPLLIDVGIRSFQAIRLHVGTETLGVLYASYHEPRTIEDGETRRFKTFAAYASLSLKKAMLLQQVTRLWDAAGVIAQVNVIGDLEEVMTVVANETERALKCDVVTVFAFNAVTGALDLPAAVSAGAKYPHRVTDLRVAEPGSLVHQMLLRNEPYICEHVPHDPMLGASRFALEEQICSSMSVPLMLAIT